jgi:hypothetical protein
MTAKNLSTVASDIITTWGQTAHHMIDAYRAVGERAARFASRRYNSALKATSSQLSDETVANARHAQKVINGYCVKGLTLSAVGAQAAIDGAVRVAGYGVAQAAAQASEFQKRTGQEAFNRVAAAVVPAALAASRLAQRVESRSAALARRAAGTTAA